MARVGETVSSDETGHEYTFVKLLRRARAGEMWLGSYGSGESKTDATHVAIKVVSEAYCAPGRRRAALAENPVEEAKTLQFLNFHGHENISVVIDVFRANSKLYVVCEYLDGGDLLELVLRSQRFTEDQARYFFLKLMEGVAYMHQFRVSHLDLSLENVVTSDDYKRVQIIDFGLAMRFRRNQLGAEMALPAGARGKPSYVAPEVLANFPFAGSAADIWCCGIMLWVMLTGAPLFENGPHRHDPMFKFVAGGQLDKILTSWRIPVSAIALDLMKNLLAINPLERPTAIQVLAHPWLTGGGVGEATETPEAPEEPAEAPPRSTGDGDVDM